MIEYSAFNKDVFSKVPKTALTILDVGCGTGILGKFLKEQNADRTVWGITYSDKEKEIADGHLDNVLVADINEKNVSPDREFDCIIFSHILEHTFFPEKVLKHFKKYLKPDGSIVIALPNIMFIWQRKEFLKGNFEYSETGGLMDVTHFRFFDWKSAQKLITDAGLSIADKKVTGNFPLGFIRKILPGSISKKIDDRAIKKWPGLFGFQFVFVAKFRH